jgi:hypothetical protein
MPGFRTRTIACGRTSVSHFARESTRFHRKHQTEKIKETRSVFQRKRGKMEA